MKILLSVNDITIVGGVERVVCNLANAFDELKFEVEILSFYAANQICAFPLNPNIKLTFFPNTFDIHSKQPLKRLFNKTIYRAFLSLKMKQMFKDKDIMIYNCYFFPYFKNKGTKYFKINHQIFKRSWSYKNRLFDTNIIIATKEMDKYKAKCANVKFIPNFIPTIPNQNSTLNQKVVLSTRKNERER